MGREKTYQRQHSNAKERRTHTSGTKETFSTDEGSVGGKKKSIAPKITSINYFSGPLSEQKPK
jgi:hypothetical protein